MKKLVSKKEIEKFEVELFLSTLCDIYGIDLHGYTKASLTRRLHVLVEKHSKNNISELVPLLIHQPQFHLDVLDGLTVQYSSLFRDSRFFKKLKKKIFPYLQTFPEATIWIAGCANGEEVFSVLIMLKELNLLHKIKIYATDINPKALEIAASGVLSKGISSVDIHNYNKSGGLYSLSDYFVMGYGKYKLKDELLSHVIFKEHNLAQDEAFVQAQFILCRNVMIYFSHELQEKVVKLLDSSLVVNGYLGIGMEESLEFLQSGKNYKQLKKEISIYKKIHT